MNKHFATIVVTLNVIISIGFLSLNNWLPPVPEKLEEIVEQRKVTATLCRNCTQTIDLSTGEAKIDGKIDDNAQRVQCVTTGVNYTPEEENAGVWFETKHLLFRNIRMSDSDAIYAYAQKPEVAARHDWQAYTSKLESIEFVKNVIEGYQNESLSPWGIEDKQTGAFIGTAGICQYSPRENYAMIEYALSDTAWNKGYELEIVQALIEFCLIPVRCKRISALARCDQPFLQEVLEQAGMSCEGIEPEYRSINGRYVSFYYYTLLRKEVDPQIMEQSVLRRRKKSKS